MIRAALEAARVPEHARPGLGEIVGIAWLAYFLVLAVAPVVAPVVLVTTAGTAPVAAVEVAVAGAGVGYVVGLVVLLRPGPGR